MALKTRLEATLEKRRGFAPRRVVDETMSQQPDELTGELGGMADHFLGGQAAMVGLCVMACGLLSFDFLLPDSRPL